MTCTKCHARVTPPAVKGGGPGLAALQFDMTPKNMAIAAAGLVVIIGCCVWIARQISRPPPAPPTWFMNQKATLVLTASPYTAKEITVAEQQNLPKDSATGFFKMDGGLWSVATKCYSCKETIPAAVVPTGTVEVAEYLAKQKCPKCGKAAYEPS